VALLVLLVIVYVLVCIFLILVVLLQQGKGADLAGAFGGGGSQTSFGPRSGSNIMHKLTTGSFVLFVVLSMSLAVISGRKLSGSAMDEVQTAPPPPASPQVSSEQPAEGTTTVPAEAPAEQPAEGTTTAPAQAPADVPSTAAPSPEQGTAPGE